MLNAACCTLRRGWTVACRTWMLLRLHHNPVQKPPWNLSPLPTPPPLATLRAIISASELLDKKIGGSAPSGCQLLAACRLARLAAAQRAAGAGNLSRRLEIASSWIVRICAALSSKRMYQRMSTWGIRFTSTPEASQGVARQSHPKFELKAAGSFGLSVASAENPKGPCHGPRVAGGKPITPRLRSSMPVGSACAGRRLGSCSAGLYKREAPCERTQ